MNNSASVKIKILEGGQLPIRGSGLAAGYDLFACIGSKGERVAIEPDDVVMVGTGVCIQPPRDVAVFLLNRSGMAFRHGLSLVTGVSLIDPDYTGEIMCAFRNFSNETQYIVHGQRIAQIVFTRYLEAFFRNVEFLDTTQRGDGGFGSTGR